MLRRLLTTTSGRGVTKSPKQTTPHHHRTALTNMLWRERFAVGNMGSSTTVYQPVQHQELVKRSSTAKRMSESYMEFLLPFRTDQHLREEYVNFFRGLRLGKILEDLDALAGSIAYKHCLEEWIDDNGQIEEKTVISIPERLPLTIVTASMDRLDLLNALRPDLDVKIQGNVTCVGKSSLEVTVRVSCFGDANSKAPIDTTFQPVDLKHATWMPLMLCKFTMVAKDPQTGKPTPINALIAETETERKIIQFGMDRKKQKLEQARTDLFKQAPTAEERLLIHELWLQMQKYTSGSGQLQHHLIPPNITLPQSTRMQTVRICHPQERNIHSSVFGGYLMREAFELAYANAMMFIKGRPYTVSMDDVAFKNPVPIGSMLFLSSEVTYSEGSPHSTFQVSVVAEVAFSQVEKNENITGKHVTNIFHFTFSASPTAASDGEHSKEVNRLMPLTYGDSMKFLQGRRRKLRGIEDKKAQFSEFNLD